MVATEDMVIRCEYESGRGKMWDAQVRIGEKQLFTTKKGEKQKAKNLTTLCKQDHGGHQGDEGFGTKSLLQLCQIGGIYVASRQRCRRRLKGRRCCRSGTK